LCTSITLVLRASDRPVIDSVTRTYDLLVGGWVLRQATVRCGVSQAVCDFLRVFGVLDGRVLYNGIETGEWNSTDIDYRRLLDLSSGDVLVSYVGRLIEAKGALDMLTVSRRLPRESGIHVAFAGSGPLASSLEIGRQESSHLHFLGRLSAAEVHDLLMASNILVHPSAYPEGLPTVLLEGAAAKAALVATPMGAPRADCRRRERSHRRATRRGWAGGSVRTLAADGALREHFGAAAGRPSVRSSIGVSSRTSWMGCSPDSVLHCPKRDWHLARCRCATHHWSSPHYGEAIEGSDHRAAYHLAPTYPGLSAFSSSRHRRVIDPQVERAQAVARRFELPHHSRTWIRSGSTTSRL